MNAYKRFLIRNRVYCELCHDFTPATDVVKNLNEQNVVLCDSHADWLRRQRMARHLFQALSPEQTKHEREQDHAHKPTQRK